MRGKDSVISYAERNKMAGVTGETSRVKFHDQQQKVRNIILKRADEMSGSDIPVGRLEAGETIRLGYEKGIANKFKGLEDSHDTFLRVYGNMPIDDVQLKKIGTKVQNIYQTTLRKQKTSLNPAVRKQAKAIEKSLDRFMVNNDFSYESVLEVVRDLGRDVFNAPHEMKKKLDVDTFRDLYFTLNESLLGTVKSAAGESIEKSIRS